MFVYYFMLFKNYLLAFMTPQFYVLLLHYWEKPDRLARIVLSLCINFNTYFFFFLVILTGLRLKRLNRLAEVTYAKGWADLFPFEITNSNFVNVKTSISFTSFLTNSNSYDYTHIDKFLYYNTLSSYFVFKKISTKKKYIKLLKYFKEAAFQLKYETQLNLFDQAAEKNLVDQLNFFLQLDQSFREVQFFRKELDSLKFEILGWEILNKYFLINHISDKQQLAIALDVLNNSNIEISYKILVLENFIFYRLKF